MRLYPGNGSWHFYRSRGWLGLRLGRRYWYLRRLRLHRLYFSERNRHCRRRLAVFGDWQLWLYTTPKKKEAPRAEDPDPV